MRFLLSILFVLGFCVSRAQVIDTTYTCTESGTQTHQARNTITFGPGYTYTPSGGSMTAEIVNPIVTGDVSYSTLVDPLTRSLNTSYLVGTTNGAFNVDALGGATYTIPLQVPEGVGGFAPALSLTYSSNSGNGIAGYGWNIAGLSAITRSPQTYYHDGATVGVNLTSTDRFSLDGQRLICVYLTDGANNSVYATETDNFSKITCLTDGTTTPKKFLVKTKSGETIEYGYEGDSDQTIDGLTEEVSWYIDKRTDLYGNTIEYEYIKQFGHNYIAEIRYGPNTVTFCYKERPDKETSYFAGGTLQQKLILSTVEMKYNSTLIKKYELKYNNHSSNYGSYSVLNEVIEYGINNSRYNSTAFSYITPDAVSFSLAKYHTTNYNVSYQSKLYPGDFNGDGVEDIFSIGDPDITGNYTGWRLNINDRNNSFSSYSGDFSIDETKIEDIFVTDLNADGKDDLIISLPSESSSLLFFYYALSSGQSMSDINIIVAKLNSKIISPYAYTQDRSGDFDGDGIGDCFITDLFGHCGIYSFSYSNGELGNFGLKYSVELGTLESDDKIFISDFDGDNISDIWISNDDGITIYSLIGGSLSEVYSSYIPEKDHYFYLGDFNGDGKTDMFIYGYNTSDWSNWQIRLSNGSGFDTKYIPKKKNNLKDDNVRVGDFNGDGASDLMVMATDDAWSGHYYYTSKNQGTDFFSDFYSGSQPSTNNYFVGDFNGDGRDDYLTTDGESSPWWIGYMIYKSGTKNKYLLEKASDGINHLTKWTYKTLSQPGTPYTKGTGATFPVIDYQGPLSVVDSVWTDNGLGSQNITKYAYEGAKIHLQGKGFLCYTKTKQTDVTSNMWRVSNYSYNTTRYLPELTSVIDSAGTTRLNITSNTWSYLTTATGVIFPYISQSTQTDNLTGHSVTSNLSSIDSYGNPTQISKTYNNGVTETVTNSYTNDPTTWLLGKLTSSTTNYAKSGETTISNTVSYTYYTDGILKPDFIRYYEGTSLSYYKNHDYNSHGNLTQLYEYGEGVGARQTNYTYETNGIRLRTITDPLLHTTTENYDTYGRLSSEVDFLNKTASYTYDNMGRVLTATDPYGLISTTSYNWGLTGGPTNAVFYVQNSTNEGAVKKTWHDELGREIRSDLKGFNGSYIYTVAEFNNKGQVYRVSEPGTTTTPSLWNVNTYDTNGRIDYIDRASGMDTDYSYSTNRVTETTGGITSWKETDSQGQLTTAHDNGGDIVYAYYPDGKVKTITAPGSVVTTMEYNDAARNQTRLVDPSAGTINYTYNSFGQMATQANARNQTTTFNYYADGRPNTKVTPEGTTTYSYNGNKQLTGISSPGSVSRSYTYDTKGRVTNISETIPGASAFSTTFVYGYTGRDSLRTHPSGITETYGYNSNGYLSTISAGGATRYTVTAMNARQQITAATLGSSLNATYGFDDYGYPTYSKAQVSGTYRQDYRYSFNTVTGNLSSRQNYLKSKTESFTYDNINRLAGVSGPQNLTMGYNANGNIETKSDVGTNAYEYDHPTKPYALTDIATSSGLVSDTLQLIRYTSFEQPDTIAENPYRAVFSYNSEGQRCKMVVTQNGSTIMTRWYAGSRYMLETGTEHNWGVTWVGGDAYTAPVMALSYSGNTVWLYVLRDYLGNITHITSSSGSVLYEYSYDAWGRRRDKDTWGYPIDDGQEILAGRGFTAHEYLPWFNLYNMNGRMYDPVVGRFLSVDNYVQNPDFSQSYNRYSYCLNNPLVYFDPTGEKFKWKWKYLVPILCFEDIMQAINDNTKGLRQKMVDAGIPDFGVGVSVNGAGNVNVNGSYKGQEVFNTENIDKSNADQKGNQAINDARQAYGAASANRIAIDEAYKFGVNKGSLQDFINYYDGWNIRDIKKDLKSGIGDGVHFVYDGATGKYIDMKHMLVAGQYGNAGGLVKETLQLFTTPGSAFNKQDLFSNNLGHWFYYQYGFQMMLHPTHATNYINKYLSTPKYFRYLPFPYY